MGGNCYGGYNTERGSTVDSKIVNNTLYKNGTLDEGGPQIEIQYDTENNIIKQNVMVAGKANVLIENPYKKNIGNTVDHNLYSAPGGSSKTLWVWKKKKYEGFSKYKNETGNDTHSFFVPPELVNASSNDNPWYIDESAPSADLGEEGDLYWNTKNDDVYKKTSDGWEKIINLKGSKDDTSTMLNNGNDNNNGGGNSNTNNNNGMNNTTNGIHTSNDSGQGGLLPVTASNIPSLILAGLFMAIVGGVLLFWRRKSLN